MKLRMFGGHTVAVTLSRRNLEALLLKLEDPESMKTISIHEDGYYLTVEAEENDTHYADRPAGLMRVKEEQQISRPPTGVR